MLLEPMVVTVRVLSSPTRPSSHAPTGFVRKTLGINFVGETREEGRMYIADCIIEGAEGNHVRLFHTFDEKGPHAPDILILEFPHVGRYEGSIVSLPSS